MTYPRLALYTCGGVFVSYAFLLTLKYYALGYYDWDLAFFTQASWNLLHGQDYVSLAGIKYFGDHSYLLTWLTQPFFAAIPSPLTLLYLKISAQVLTGALLYAFAADLIGRRCAFWVMLLFFIFPANIFGLLYEFNPEAFAPPLILLSFMALRRKSYAKLILWLGLLMAIKENMCLVALMFLLYGSLRADQNNKAPLRAFAAFTLVFFLYLCFLWIPSNRGLSSHSFVVRYSNLGASTLELFLSPLFEFPKIAAAMVSPVNMYFYLSLFGVLLLPSLFSPLPILMMLPLLMQHGLSIKPSDHMIYYHYGPAMAAFVFVAYVFTLKKLGERWRKPGWVVSLAMFFVVANVVVGIMAYRDFFLLRWNIRDALTVRQCWGMIKDVPPKAGVIASFEFLAPLATREELYSFHKTIDDDYQDSAKMKQSELYTGRAFQIPSGVTYALINHDDPWIAMIRRKDPLKYERRVKDALRDFELVKKSGPISLYRRRLH